MSDEALAAARERLVAAEAALADLAAERAPIDERLDQLLKDAALLEEGVSGWHVFFGGVAAGFGLGLLFLVHGAPA